MTNKHYAIVTILCLAFTGVAALLAVATLSNGFYTAHYIYIGLMCVCGFTTVCFALCIQYSVNTQSA